DRRRQRLPLELRQRGLEVEQVELARGTGHEQVNDAPRLRGEVRLPRRQRIVRSGRGGPRAPRPGVAQQAGQRDLADAEAALAEEVAARRGERGRKGRTHRSITLS